MIASALLASLALGAYQDQVFDSITDPAKCGPAIVDNKTRKPYVYYAPDAAPGVPGPELLDELKRYLNKLQFNFYLADDPLRPKHLCLGFYDDTAAPNAFAWGPEHLVLGVTLTRVLLNESALKAMIDGYIKSHDQNPAIAVNLKIKPAEAFRFVVSHEIGHNLQERHQLRFGGDTVMTKELHADCAAAFITTFYSGGENLSSEDQRKTAQFLSLVLGDHHLTEVNHHGTPAERLGAVQYGMIQGATALINGWDDNDVTSGVVMAICSQKYPTAGGKLKVPSVKPWVFRDVENAPNDEPKPDAGPPRSHKKLDELMKLPSH